MKRAAVLVMSLASALACSNRDAPSASREAVPVAQATPPGADPWAPAEQRALPPPAVNNPLPRPFFWAARKDGRTTHLLGTMHVGVDAEQRIPLWVWNHFDAATTLVEEVNIQDPTFTAWTVRPAGPTLRDQLGDAYWAKLEEVVAPFVAHMLDRSATAVATLRVSSYGGGGGGETNPMDGNLLVRARGLKKRIVFLENPQQQGKLLTELMSLEALKLLLDRREQLAKLNQAFFAAYEAGDDQAFFTAGSQTFGLHTRDAAALERFLDTLLVERNRAWIPALEEAHAAGGAFVAVGALHLVGDDNVLELLRARGFAIERVEPPR